MTFFNSRLYSQHYSLLETQGTGNRDPYCYGIEVGETNKRETKHTSNLNEQLQDYGSSTYLCSSSVEENWQEARDNKKRRIRKKRSSVPKENLHGD